MELVPTRTALTPKASYATAQGRESASAPWVVWVMESITPKGFHTPRFAGMCNPFRVTGLFGRLTQGALADSRPWAVLCNPFGVKADPQKGLVV